MVKEKVLLQQWSQGLPETNTILGAVFLCLRLINCSKTPPEEQEDCRSAWLRKHSRDSTMSELELCLVMDNAHSIHSSADTGKYINSWGFQYNYLFSYYSLELSLLCVSSSNSFFEPFGSDLQNERALGFLLPVTLIFSQLVPTCPHESTDQVNVLSSVLALGCARSRQMHYLPTSLRTCLQPMHYARRRLCFAHGFLRSYLPHSLHRRMDQDFRKLSSLSKTLGYCTRWSVNYTRCQCSFCANRIYHSIVCRNIQWHIKYM